MSLPVTVTFGAIDPSLKMPNAQAIPGLLQPVTTASLDGDFSFFIFGSDVPSTDDQDKVWIRKTPAGAPLGTYVFYNGFWVREPPPIGSRIGFWSGDPTGILSTDSSDYGKGLPGAGPVANDVFGWALANGKNGTADLSNQFLIGAKMSGTWLWDGALWQTSVRGSNETQGGVNEITLDENNTFRLSSDALVADHFDVSGVTHDATGDLWGDPNGTDDFNVLPADDGNESPDPISIINPFYALAILAWIGYG